MHAAHNLAKEHAEGSRWLLIVADIDRLRDVNGLYGFGFGDELLRQFARRLSSMCVAPGDGGASRRRPVRATGAGFGCRGQQSAWHDHRIPGSPVPHRRVRADLDLACWCRPVSRSRQQFSSADARGGAGARECPTRQGCPGGNVRPADQPGRDGKQDVGEGVAQRGRARGAGAATTNRRSISSPARCSPSRPCCVGGTPTGA